MSDLVLTQDDATPNPPANTASIYPKTDGLFYTKTPAGVETALKGTKGDTGTAATVAAGTTTTLAPGSSATVVNSGTTAAAIFDFGIPGGLPVGGTANQLPGKDAAGTAMEWKTIAGTTNRVSVTHGVGTVTISAPQDLHTTASPTFTAVSANLTGNVTGNADTATAAGKSTNLVGGNNTTLLGAIPYQSNTDTTTLLGPNTTTTKKFLRETGNGTNGAAPAWDTLASGDIPNNAADTSGNAATATACTTATKPATGTARGAVTLNASAEFQSVAPGTTGNVLTSDGTDWKSAAAPVSTTLTTKGDIQTFSTVNARLAVGATDGMVLSVKASETTGLKWVTVNASFTTQNFTGTAITTTADGFQRHRYTGSSAQVMTAPTLTLIADAGTLEILGTSNTNTLTIPEGLTGIVRLNGPMELGLGNTIVFRNDTTLGGLYEVSRT